METPAEQLIPTCWKSTTADHYIAAAMRLQALGMPDSEIEDFLAGLHSATGADYGD